MTTVDVTRTPAQEAMDRAAAGARSATEDARVDYAGDYVVCLCLDGHHGPREHAGAYPSKASAAVRYGELAGPKHIVRRHRLTVSVVEEVTPW